ncbi:MAG: hypothetical protein LLF86_05115 [Nitrospiraceae bacterium]|nr:hypothetical protein [Nitrospiraceae bacterium]
MKARKSEPMDRGQTEAKMRSLSDVDLNIIATTKVPCEERSIAQEEIRKRERRRNFWKKDIVAWLALVLSIISLFLGLKN